MVLPPVTQVATWPTTEEEKGWRVDEWIPQVRGGTAGWNYIS